MPQAALLRIAVFLVSPTLALTAGTPTSTVLLTSGSPSIFGRSVQLIANVTPASASGRVTFYDGATVLGTSTLSAGQGILNTILLPAGERRLRAYYSGSAAYTSSASADVKQQVTGLPEGGFGTTTTNPIGAAEYLNTLAVGDFNGDGKPDLVTAFTEQDGTPLLTVLLSDGLGGFAAAPGSPFSAGANPQSLVVADFDGDGNLDLAVGNSGSYQTGPVGVAVLLGNGSGGFAPVPGSPFLAGTDVRALAAGDFNGDGKPDLAIAVADDSITVLAGNGIGGFSSSSPFDGGMLPSYLAVGDFNGDGRADLAVMGFIGTKSYDITGELTIFLGDGAGGFSTAPGTPVSFPHLVQPRPYLTVVADFNGDGIDDLALGGATPAVFLGTTAGSLTPTPALAGGGSPVAAGDFNGDGKTDLVTLDFLNNVLDVLLGDGTGAFAEWGQRSVSVAPGPVAVADFNGDGRADVAVVDFYGANLTLLLGAPGVGPCSVAVNTSDTSGTVPSSGGTGSLYVAASECSWFVASDAPWLAITMPAGVSGTGNGTVTWSAQANYTKFARTAALVIGDQSFIVSQAAAPPCTVMLDKTTVDLSDAPANFLLNVTASADCDWTATSNAIQLNILQATTDVNGNPILATVPALPSSGNGILNIQVRRNTSSQPQTGTFDVNGVVLTVNQAGSAFDANTRFIYAMYNNLLAREPDAGGMAIYQTVLANGSYTRDHVALDMVNSPEFNTDERFAVGLYYGILGRDPEYSGWDFHRRNLHLLRVDQGSLTAAFLGSTEYLNKYGSVYYSTPTDYVLTPPPVDVFITEMYQNAFSRTPSTSEISAWEGSIATSSRALAAQTMLASPEFAAGKSVRQNIFLIHAGLLGRVPTIVEFTNFTNAITGGESLQQAIAEILTGAEFTNKFGP
jgi:Bacterial Ig-like domain (group 3)/Domain of unknown function (DUF4214)/FG-GAP-like repeat